MFVDDIRQHPSQVACRGHVHPKPTGNGHLLFVTDLNDLSKAHSDHSIVDESLRDEVNKRTGVNVFTKREFRASKVEYRHFNPFYFESTEEREQTA